MYYYYYYYCYIELHFLTSLYECFSYEMCITRIVDAMAKTYLEQCLYWLALLMQRPNSI